MQINELAQGLAAKLAQNRIVFWHDPEHSFAEEFESLAASLIEQNNREQASLPSDLVILNMSKQSMLAVKRRIELDEKEKQFLLYFPCAEPDHENDWLLDMRLYSGDFFADHSSILLHELGIQQMSLRSYINKRLAFFANKQRLTSFKKWIVEDEN
ncbi:MAG: BREX-1 system phosphatase PglZ type A, partial [Vibrionaceae bacterium]